MAPIVVTLGTSGGPGSLQKEVHELRSRLAAVDGTSLLPRETPPGAKGGMTDIVVNTATIAGVLGVVRIFALWLKRDRRRTLTLSRKRDGQPEETIRISGEAISLEIIEAAVARLADVDMDGEGEDRRE